MGFEFFAIQSPGEPATWNTPALNDDMSLQWESIDGNVAGPFHATAIKEWVRNERKGKFVVSTEISEIRAPFYLTESRLVFVCPKYDKGGGWVGAGDIGLPVALVANVVSKARAAHRSRGTALVGQLRLPWIWSIQFTKKTGWLSDEKLNVYFKEGGVTRYVEIVLDKHEDAASFAYQAFQNVLRYRIEDRDPKTAERVAELRAALAAGPVQASASGEFADYDVPGDYFTAGRGDEEAPLFPPSSARNEILFAEPAPGGGTEPTAPDHGMVSQYAVGEPEDVRYPSLNPDGSIRFEPADGEIIGPLVAQSVTDYVAEDQGGRLVEIRECWMRDPSLVAYITASRVLFTCPDSDGGGTWAGQVRHSWPAIMEFTVKQGWLSEESLRLIYEDAGDGRLHILELTLAKTESAAALAAEVVRRIARYRLAVVEPQDPAVVAELRRIRELRDLPVPAKNAATRMDLPGFMQRGADDERPLATAPPTSACEPRSSTSRFNPAPGWPPPPPGWMPGPDWRPDPAWPPAPPGWQLYV